MFFRDVKKNFALRVVFSFFISILMVALYLFLYFFLSPIFALLGIINMQNAVTEGFTETRWTMFGVFYVSFALLNMYYYFLSDKTLNKEEQKELEEEREAWRREHDPKYKMEMEMEKIMKEL